MSAILYSLSGAVAGAVVIGLLARQAADQGNRRRLALYALGLVGAALIYVARAAAADVGPGGRGHLPVEALGLSLFTLLAALGLARWPALLALGWAGHALWDLLRGAHAAYIPAWYPPACGGFDLVVAGYLAWLLWRRPAKP
jgi:hypothetical protein